MNDPNIIVSPLSGEFDAAGRTVRIEIYRLEDSRWTLEVVDAAGTSIVWDGQFDTDTAAKAEFERSVAEEGLHSIITGSAATRH